MPSCSLDYHFQQGTGDAPKIDEFLEKFQTAFELTLFRKIMLQIFSPKIMIKNPCYV